MVDINIMPLARTLGVKVVEARADLVVGELEVRPEICTAGHILHGGAYMAFADCLGALATVLNLPAGAHTTTVESKTNFLGAVREGETARGETVPVHIGRTIQVWQTTIFRPDGKKAAVVTQSQLIMAPKE